MNKLKEEELEKINGGGALKWFIIGGVVTFVIGLINGIQRPLSCSSSK